MKRRTRAEIEADAMAALDQLHREFRSRAYPPHVNLDDVDRLVKRIALGPKEWARRYSHAGTRVLGRRQAQASRLKIAQSMKRVVSMKPRDTRGRFAPLA
jgi:hypothetical protein